MLSTHKLMFTAIITSVSMGACMTDNGSQPAGDTGSDPQLPSADELASYLRATPNSPLEHLSPAAKQRFIDSLVFTAYGLGSYRYSELEELSATEIYEILHLFKAERTVSLIANARVLNDSDKAIMEAQGPIGLDHYSYKCDGPSTCVSAINYICLSTCSSP